MSKELENLHELRLKQAQKAPVQAIRSFIMNDSQNRTGLWEYITGWALIEGRLQQVNPKWRQFYKWFKEKDWELCNFNSFVTVDNTRVATSGLLWQQMINLPEMSYQVLMRVIVKGGYQISLNSGLT